DPAGSDLPDRQRGRPLRGPAGRGGRQPGAARPRIGARVGGGLPRGRRGGQLAELLARGLPRLRRRCGRAGAVPPPATSTAGSGGRGSSPTLPAPANPSAAPDRDPERLRKHGGEPARSLYGDPEPAPAAASARRRAGGV